MIDLRVSPQNTGACPICKKRNKCKIISKLAETMDSCIDTTIDNTVELVIYRCPEFREGSPF